eukprot:314876-Amphidinium_carterae.2
MMLVTVYTRRFHTSKHEPARCNSCCRAHRPRDAFDVYQHLLSVAAWPSAKSDPTPALMPLKQLCTLAHEHQ